MAVIQLIKLFLCTYKRVIIHIRIFDIIIKIGKKKLFTSEDMNLLDEPEYNIQARKNKIYEGKEYAYERKEAQQEDELRRRKEQFERKNVMRNIIGIVLKQVMKTQDVEMEYLQPQKKREKELERI